MTKAHPDTLRRIHQAAADMADIAATWQRYTNAIADYMKSNF